MTGTEPDDDHLVLVGVHVHPRQDLFEGVQVNPYRGTYRDEITMFRATEDVPVAVSYAWHNPQFGEGGLRQVYVHEMQSLIERGVLEMVDQRPLTNTTARLTPVCAAP